MMFEHPLLWSVASWTLTYLIHSTVLILAVWLLCRSDAMSLSHRVQNFLWRVALVGGLVTSAAQLAWQGDLALARWQLPAATTTTSSQALATDRIQAADERKALPLRRRPTVDMIVEWRGDTRVAIVTRPDPLPVLVSDAPVIMQDAPSAPSMPSMPSIPVLLLGLAMAASMAAVGHLALRLRRVRRQLASRRDVRMGRAWEELQELCARAGVTRPIRLTRTLALSSPVALGRSEICLPGRMVEGSPAGQRRAALAHELAHLQRNDPWWLLAALWLEALFIFQPLHRIVRRELQTTCEYACDDFAVSLTGCGMELARALAEVAAFAPADEGHGDLMPAMAGRHSPFVLRVERLIHRDAASSAPVRLRHIAIAGIGLLTLALFAPVVATASAPEPSGEVDSAEDAAASARVRRAQRRADRAEQRAAKAVERAARTRVQAEALAPTHRHVHRDRARHRVHRLPDGTVHMVVAPAPPSPPAAPLPPSARAMPPIPTIPPIPAMPPIPPVGPGDMPDVDMRGLDESVQAFERAHRSQRQAAAQLQSLRARKASAQEISAAEQRLASEQRRFETAEARLERETEVFEKKMEAWGEGFGAQMEAWGERYGAQMEAWGEQMGERFGEQFERDMERFGAQMEVFGQQLEAAGEQAAHAVEAQTKARQKAEARAKRQHEKAEERRRKAEAKSQTGSRPSAASSATAGPRPNPTARPQRAPAAGAKDAALPSLDVPPGSAPR